MSSSFCDGRYQLVAELGSGSQGRVVHAIDERHERDVALKIRPVAPGEERSLLLNEAKVLLNLRPHPNLPIVRDDFFDGDTYVLVMDFIPGPSLAQLLREQGDPGLTPSLVVAYLEQLAAAVDHLHGHEPPVIHGDIKPDNIIIEPSGRVVLVDFGLVGMGPRSGTRGYMAPEVSAGQPAGKESDIYALAATATELLVGEPPGAGPPTFEGMHPGLRAPFERVLRRGLTFDPRRRPSTAREFVERFQSAIALDLPSGVVTFLLTDIEGSTQLWERHHDAMGLAIDRYERLIAHQVEEHEGTFLKSKGEGDSTVSVFRSVGSALEAALAIARDLDTEPWPHGIELKSRTALHTGEPQLRDGDYYGSTLNKAARIRSVARGGQIVCSSVTANLLNEHLPAGTRLDVLGTRALRGLSQPELVHLVVQDAVEPRSVEVGEEHPPSSLPIRLSQRSVLPIVGREVELDELSAFITDPAPRVMPRLVLLRGEAGVGKSTLAAELGRRAWIEGAATLWGCFDEDSPVAYQPFAQSLTHLVGELPDSLISSHLGQFGSALTHLIPGLSRRVSAEQSDSTVSDRSLLFGSIVALLSSASELRPIVLVIDDLQWCDQASGQLIKHLFTSSLSIRLTVVATCRSTSFSSSKYYVDLLAALRREPGVVVRDIAGLGHGDIAELIALAGVESDLDSPSMASVIHAETEGNAFYVTEILRDLLESDDRILDRSSGDRLRLPDSISDVLRQRLDRLDEPGRRILRAAAVVGTEFPLSLVAEMCSIDPLEALDQLEVAVAAGFIREISETPGWFRFSHALVQRTVYDEVGAARRAQSHELAGQLIARDGDLNDLKTLVNLSWHLSFASSPGARATAARYNRLAGERMLAALAPDNAMPHFTAALDLLDQVSGFADQTPERVRTLTGLGTAQRQLGMAEFVDTLLTSAHVALSSGDTDGLVDAALAMSRGSPAILGGMDERQIEILEQALEALADESGPRRALLLASLCGELTYGTDWDRRRSLADEALEIARQTGDPQVICSVINNVQIPLAVPQTAELRIALGEEAKEMAIRCGDPRQEFAARTYLAYAQGSMGDIDAVQQEHLHLERLVLQSREPAMDWAFLYNRAGVQVLIGNPGMAEELATEALEVGMTSGQPDAFSYYSAQFLAIRLQQGRLAELVDLVQQAIDDNPDLVALRGGAALVFTAAGLFDEASSMLQAAIAAEPFGSVGFDASWQSGIAVWAEVAIHLGDRVAAASLLELLAPIDDRIVFDGVLSLGSFGALAGGLASVVGEFDQATRHFTRGLELARRVSSPYAEARVEIEWAKALAKQGESNESAARATRAAELAKAGGYQGIARMVEALISD